MHGPRCEPCVSARSKLQSGLVAQPTCHSRRKPAPTCKQTRRRIKRPARDDRRSPIPRLPVALHPAGLRPLRTRLCNHVFIGYHTPIPSRLSPTKIQPTMPTHSEQPTLRLHNPHIPPFPQLRSCKGGRCADGSLCYVGCAEVYDGVLGGGIRSAIFKPRPEVDEGGGHNYLSYGDPGAYR